MTLIYSHSLRKILSVDLQLRDKNAVCDKVTNHGEVDQGFELYYSLTPLHLYIVALLRSCLVPHYPP